MFKKYVLFLFLIASFGVQAECPYSIKDATVMLTLENKINLKISSSAMCNQKDYFADRFIDADVELWKSGKLLKKFYSRKVTYDQSNLKMILQNSSELITENSIGKNLDQSKLFILDLKKKKLSSSEKEIRF